MDQQLDRISSVGAQERSEFKRRAMFDAIIGILKSILGDEMSEDKLALYTFDKVWNEVLGVPFNGNVTMKNQPIENIKSMNKDDFNDFYNDFVEEVREFKLFNPNDEYTIWKKSGQTYYWIPLDMVPGCEENFKMSYIIKDLKCSYPSSPLPVLNIEELSIEPNEVVFFVGPSGVGKSTLLETLALMNNTICDSNIENTKFDYIYSERKEKIDFMTIWDEPETILSRIRNDFYSFIFQQNNLFSSLTGFQNAIASSIIQGTHSNIAKSNAKSVFNEILIDLNISSGDFEITKMSGGQRQRLAFIRAIITKYSILFADEPTGNLDWLNARILMDFLLKELRSNKSSAIIVSHDIDLAIEYADKIIYIEKKKTF